MTRLLDGSVLKLHRVLQQAARRRARVDAPARPERRLRERLPRGEEDHLPAPLSAARGEGGQVWRGVGVV